MIKQVLSPLAAACLLGIASQALASPSPYSTLVVFGDSLSDAGQFPDADGPAGASTRFTNRVGPTYLDGSGEVFGPTAAMILGGKLGVAAGDLGPSTSLVNAAEGLPDGNNWAVGGYRTDQIYDSITAAGGSVVSANGQTRTRDGYLVGRLADPNALYYLTGGGNDFLQFRITDDPSARAAAGRLVDSAQALSQAGARYIMVWLLPDLGLTPATNGTVLQSFGTQLSGIFNEELVSQLASSGANVIPLNIPLMLQEVLADPGAYGLATGQNLVGTCFSGNSCPENPVYGRHGSSPDPTKLIFNDGVHPTIAGQTLIADYAYSVLSAPWEATLLPEMAHGTLRAYQDELRSQWLADWENWQGVGQWRGFVTGGGQHLDYDDQDSAASGDGFGYNLTLGGSLRLDDAWRAGIAAGFYRQKLEAGAEDSDYKLNSYLGSLFVQYQQDRWWGDAAVTGGYLDYDEANRKFAIGPRTVEEKGDTNGNLLAFSGRIGYDIAQGGEAWHLSPFVSADWARVKVDGYDEGNASTSLSFDEQMRYSRRLGVGLQGKYALSEQTQLFGEVAVEREYADDTQNIGMAFTSLPANGFTLQGYTPQSHLQRATLGFARKLTPELSLRGGYSAHRSDDDLQQGVSLALSLDF
ncbi:MULTISPECIES: esterase EstP [unclassified Pseudomonas]|uniref:esterase EstP n=1 Tax=unclassified Pseudomonas TaxID=196821 RepID=UPI0002A204BE|nr:MULTISPECIES: esterase EstP [unclassified Pseudomonas]MBB1610266.1 autotransporter outer membrane beta-barrel domain-containing protein [Pseudomonas sp. UMC76]MBB1639929.1 autotransporter outer membrane beta-barrel domain-containing protein [Pseudomonas sp. UME83]NTX90758.1 autotransporter domain-containing protein [Pseudomonas sp. UMA643]NTY17197.1 autotransporter domain-containing protein [Pseudomonas sp. UMC3103]NTY26650.1 autotransporter domain-containing protein [Pseudomonas sp. UMA603